MNTESFEQHKNASLVEECKFIPLRLSEDERRKLDTLIAALKVSEYTSEVDTLSRRHKSYRIIDAIQDMVRIGTGLSICSQPAKMRSIGSMNGNEIGQYFAELFEIGRRHKIMNPAKMRSEYGKLMYMLQDAQSRGAKESLGCSFHLPIKMVSSFVEKRGATALLWDARLPIAVGREKGNKGAARQELIQEYSKGKNNMQEESLTQTEIALVIDSIDDARCYEEQSIAPIETMLHLLESAFDPRAPTPQRPASLSLRRGDPAMLPIKQFGTEEEEEDGDNYQDDKDDIDAEPEDDESSPKKSVHDDDDADDDTDRVGDDSSDEEYRPRYRPGPVRAIGSRIAHSLGGGLSRLASNMQNLGGAKLMHDHPTQYTYVRQSLLLWREVMHNMYRLWIHADDDLLISSNGEYQLWNTGQGLNRVQSCPRIGSAMRQILTRVQRESGLPWVGLSVVHLGDRDVPNALMFIDKYTQVPRLLAPIAMVVQAIPKLCKEDQAVRAYVKQKWGSPNLLQLTILADFFKRAFDGDGDDGGSCIDGRLTSAWNWCSKIVKKDYYPIFNMAGFSGFDGGFREDD